MHLINDLLKQSMTDKKETKEEWRDIPCYEGRYQASSLGRIRSLDRTVVDSRGGKRFYRGQAIEGCVHKGYRRTGFRVGGSAVNYSFAQLVAMTFIGHKPDGYKLVVDHINGDRSDDRLENLRIVTHRTNLSTCFRSDRGSFSSNHIGVCWSKGNSKWQAKIQYDGNVIHLGYFTDEIEASSAYQLALLKIKEGSFSPGDYKPKFTSKYKGVSFNKRDEKWTSYITINGKSKFLGYFHTELEAHQAYQNKLKELDNNTNK